MRWCDKSGIIWTLLHQSIKLNQDITSLNCEIVHLTGVFQCSGWMPLFCDSQGTSHHTGQFKHSSCSSDSVFINNLDLLLTGGFPPRYAKVSRVSVHKRTWIFLHVSLYLLHSFKSSTRMSFPSLPWEFAGVTQVSIFGCKVYIFLKTSEGWGTVDSCL